MKIRKKFEGVAEGDLTPMIDMTFQLIAFFMVVINFNQMDQNQRIQLPESTLARPPEDPFEYQITMHLTEEVRDGQGIVIINANDLPINAIKPILNREASILQNQGKSKEDATIIIRAHKDAQTGYVQQLIKECQSNGYENFVLRAKEIANKQQKISQTS